MDWTDLIDEDIVPIRVEVFDFDIESDSDDEVFFGDVGFTEKCVAHELESMYNVKPLPELTSEQWKEMEREAYKVVAMIRESQEICNSSLTAVHSIDTTSLSQSIKLKRKLQPLNGNSIKQSPLLNITNYSNTRLNKSSILLNSNSKCDENGFAVSPIFKMGDPSDEHLGLVKPMCLNFDDIEPSPKKIRCFNAFMSPGKELPLLINETCEGLYMNSPTAKDAIPFDFKLNEADLENSIKTTRHKSRHLNQGRSVNKRTPIKIKEPRTPESFTKKSSSTPVDEVKNSRNSILNVSFTMDGDESFLKKLGDQDLLKTPSIKFSKMLVTSGGSIESSNNKSKKTFTHKIAAKPEAKGPKSLENENLSFVGDGKGAKLAAAVIKTEKEHSATKGSFSNASELNEMLKHESRKLCHDIKEMMGNKQLEDKKDLIVGGSETALNRSFMIENSKPVSTQPSAIEGNESELNESLLINENKPSPVVDRAKSTPTDSFVISTPTDSFIKSTNETVTLRRTKTVLGESFTLLEMETSALTESFTDKIAETSLPRSLSVDRKKPLLNRSFTVDCKKPQLNESFTVRNKIPPLNESFTVKSQKPLLNESITIGVKENISNQPLTKGRQSNIRKSSQTTNIMGPMSRISLSKSSSKIKGNSTSDQQNLQDKSISKSKINPGKNPVKTFLTTTSRKRPLDSPRQNLIYSKVDTKTKKDKKSLALENNVTSKLTQAVPSKPLYTGKKLDMSFNKSLKIPKDENGMVKFQEKSSVVVVKKTKSSLLLPHNRVLKKPAKDSTTVTSTVTENSSSSNIKRKCLMSNPVLSHSSTSRIPTPGKSKITLPFKLQQPLMALNVSKTNASSQVAQKGPVKAIHKPAVKAPEKIAAPALSTRSKLPMPSSRSKIP